MAHQFQLDPVVGAVLPGIQGHRSHLRSGTSGTARSGELVQPERAAVQLRSALTAELHAMLAEVADQPGHVFRDEPTDGPA